ncbi:hypothetical protein Tco_0736155 [Tanacetum coccineum]
MVLSRTLGTRFEGVTDWYQSQGYREPGHRIRIQRTPDTASSPQSTDLHTGPRNARLRQFLRDEESSLEYPRDGGDDDDGDSSRDDVNDEDKDEDDEEDEENYRIRIDCGLSARLVLKRGDMIRDVEYGFRGTWVVLAEDLYALLEDAQDSTPDTAIAAEYSHSDPSSDMRGEMSDMQAELLALQEQQRRARQPGPEARIPDHQDASRDADSHI